MHLFWPEFLWDLITTQILDKAVICFHHRTPRKMPQIGSQVLSARKPEKPSNLLENIARVSPYSIPGDFMNAQASTLRF